MIRFLMTSCAIVWARLCQMIALTGGDHRCDPEMPGCAVCCTQARMIEEANDALQRARR